MRLHCKDSNNSVSPIFPLIFILVFWNLEVFFFFIKDKVCAFFIYLPLYTVRIQNILKIIYMTVHNDTSCDNKFILKYFRYTWNFKHKILFYFSPLTIALVCTEVKCEIILKKSDWVYCSIFSYFAYVQMPINFLKKRRIFAIMVTFLNSRTQIYTSALTPNLCW